jgi:hypothetical protein
MTTHTSSDSDGVAAVRAAVPADTPGSASLPDAIGLTDDAFPDRDSWNQFGRALGRASSSQLWLLGDWMLLGAARWSATLDDAARVTKLCPSRLLNARSVASKFDRSRRRESLTFDHHLEVASLDPDRADRLLDRAEAEELSVRALRELAGPQRPIPALDQRTEILAGLLRDAVSERKRLASIPGADLVRIAHEKYVSALEALAGQSLAPAPAPDDDRASPEDLKGRPVQH